MGLWPWNDGVVEFPSRVALEVGDGHPLCLERSSAEAGRADGWWAAERPGSTLVPSWGVARNVHYRVENIGVLV